MAENLGYDVAYQSPATDAQLALKALRENRVILTRDRDFTQKRQVYIGNRCG